MRIALGLEYDGNAFCGWQSQPSGCGVQDHLEKALTAFADRPVSVIAAGRTDTGVHATAQVVHFDTDAVREDHAWVRGPNSHLDPRVRVLWACPVADEFHARFSAVSRTYHYLLLDDPVAPGALSGRLGWFHKPLDVAAMAEAAAMFLGEHDFGAFRSAECQAKSPVKLMHEARVERRSNLIVFTFRASAFLHHMVRNLVGSLVYVGAERLDAEGLAKVFASRDRRTAAPTFAPDGLYLAAIEYDSRFALPAPRPFPLFTFP
ncbi:tRNA pseudouridine(38-40) synthase TruA [Betaproteobacteria bacterium GR16-43]|nr:tRNA pseudouridine(38-40) synthase TruA [Betaproteobacteria bacterium GR16-43]